jgi:hypothetical protein
MGDRPLIHARGGGAWHVDSETHHYGRRSYRISVHSSVGFATRAEAEVYARELAHRERAPHRRITVERYPDSWVGAKKLTLAHRIYPAGSVRGRIGDIVPDEKDPSVLHAYYQDVRLARNNRMVRDEKYLGEFGRLGHAQRAVENEFHYRLALASARLPPEVTDRRRKAAEAEARRREEIGGAVERAFRRAQNRER